jgi:tetratricopeptide (TPR) repeat protein
MNLGVIYKSTGRYGEAMDSLEQSLSTYRNIPGTETSQIYCTVNLAGLFYENIGNYFQAGRYVEETLQLCAPFPPEAIEEIRNVCKRIIEGIKDKV